MTRHPSDSRTEPGDGSPVTLKRLLGPAETLALCLLAALSIAVFLHWLQSANINAYRQSPLIVIEMLGLLGAFLFVPVFFVRAICLLAGRRFHNAIVNALICAAALGVAMWAMWLDASTLIYMT